MWAKFHEPFSFDRRPRQALAFAVQPGLKNLPRDVVEAAIAAGKAVAASPPKRKQDTNQSAAA